MGPFFLLVLRSRRFSVLFVFLCVMLSRGKVMGFPFVLLLGGVTLFPSVGPS